MSTRCPVPLDTWWLPRPSRSKFPGSFPLNFESKLYTSLGNPPEVLHPFGGAAESGVRVDINPELKPDVVGDAHALPFEDDSFDLVVCDPPYSDKESQEIYGTGKLKQSKWMAEAVRVSRRYIVVFHERMLPRPKGTLLVRVICVLLRPGHSARICCIYKKQLSGADHEQLLFSEVRTPRTKGRKPTS